MKKFSVCLAVLMLSVAFTAGCGNLGAELIDKLGEPKEIYHSGKDSLSGKYTILPKNSTDKPADMALRFDEKGWKLSEGDSPEIHVYEVRPEEMQKLFGSFDANTMQCAGVATFKFCKAPKGSRIKTDKVDATMGENYIAIIGDTWDNVVKK